MEKIKNNKRLNEGISYVDPDLIAEVTIDELNNILEEISPSHVVQRKRKNEPKGPETERKKEECLDS